MMRVLVLLAAVGCSFPEKHRAGGDGGGGDSSTMQDGTGSDGSIMGDGGSGPFGCVGLPFPTTAPPIISFQGMVQVSMGTPFLQFPVQGIVNQTGVQFFSTNADANGNYMASVPTNGVAIDGHLYINGQPSFGYFSTYYYPRRPFDSNQTNLQLPVEDQTTLQQTYSSAGRNFNANQATAFLQLTDCNGSPLDGATLTMQPAPTQGIVYLRNNSPDPAATATDSTGVAIAFGVNPQITQVTGMAATGEPLHVYTIPFMPQSLYVMVVQPGPNMP